MIRRATTETYEGCQVYLVGPSSTTLSKVYYNATTEEELPVPMSKNEFAAACKMDYSKGDKVIWKQEGETEVMETSGSSALCKHVVKVGSSGKLANKLAFWVKKEDGGMFPEYRFNLDDQSDRTFVQLMGLLDLEALKKLTIA